MSILDSIKNIGEELLNTDNKNVEIKPDITAAGKRTYTVKSGDTLSRHCKSILQRCLSLYENL